MNFVKKKWRKFGSAQIFIVKLVHTVLWRKIAVGPFLETWKLSVWTVQVCNWLFEDVGLGSVFHQTTVWTSFAAKNCACPIFMLSLQLTVFWNVLKNLCFVGFSIIVFTGLFLFLNQNPRTASTFQIFIYTHFGCLSTDYKLRFFVKLTSFDKNCQCLHTHR